MLATISYLHRGKRSKDFDQSVLGQPESTLNNSLTLILIFCSVNVTVGEKQERIMMTGMHTVVDIFCVGCGSIVGWKYVRFSLHSCFYLVSDISVTSSF